MRNENKGLPMFQGLFMAGDGMEAKAYPSLDRDAKWISVADRLLITPFTLKIHWSAVRTD